MKDYHADRVAFYQEEYIRSEELLESGKLNDTGRRAIEFYQEEILKKLNAHAEMLAA